MNDACPCKNCDTRYMYCHSECVAYNFWKNEKHKESEQIHKLKCEQAMLDKVKKNAIKKWARKHKRT